MTAPNRAASTAASVGKTSLVLRDRFTPEQVELLKKTIAKGASDDEFALFLHNCERTGLDPFAKQIYCLQRRTKNDEGQWVNAMVTQVGIDGKRLIAQRTGQYRGQTVPVFFDKAGNPREVWLDAKVPPVACRVGVRREGFDEPLYVTAHYGEYVQRTRDNQPNKMWKEKPCVMLAKCAESQAMNKAFPQELSGLYIEEELRDEPVDADPAQISAQHTRARLVDPDQSATVTPDGHIQLTFGEHRNKRICDVPTSYLISTFREAWKDANRKAVAEQRLGAGFVATVYAELTKRNVPEDLSARVAKLLERREAGEVLLEDDAEDARQWDEDHKPAVVAVEAQS